jgi:hypothetical protein
MAWTVSGNIKGPKGDTGATGSTGPAGAGVQITGTAATYANLPTGLTSGDAGHAYIVTTDGASHTGYLYVWDGSAFPADGSGVPFQGPKGDTGAAGTTGSTGSAGAAATLAIGTTTTLAAGAPATASNSGTSSAAVLDLGIPAGAKGDTGDTGATGATGTTGSAGARGSNWYTGSGAPGSISGSAAGDQYLDTDSGDVYTLS